MYLSRKFAYISVFILLTLLGVTAFVQDEMTQKFFIYATAAATLNVAIVAYVTAKRSGNMESGGS